MNLNSSHDHATRYKSRLLPPFERLELCKNAFFCKSIHLWNNLNSNIKECRSLNTFKSKVKLLFIEDNKPATLLP